MGNLSRFSRILLIIRGLNSLLQHVKHMRFIILSGFSEMLILLSITSINKKGQIL